MKTAEETKKEIIDRVLSREYGSWESIANDAYDEGYVQGQSASHPPDAPVSGEELTEVIWGEPLRNSYNKGFLDSKKEQIIDFIKWIGDQDLKRYSEGWCQPGGSNGFHYSDDDLYKLFCNRKNTATLPTREQGERKFSQSEIEALQSSIYKITGKGEVMALFNKMLGVNAG